MSEPKLGVHSEAGTLRQVIVSPPGLAHRRLTPDNREDLLFDDVFWVKQAIKDHAVFADVMRGEGVEVLDAMALLGETLDISDARAWVLDHRITRNDVGVGMRDDLRAWMEGLPGTELARLLVGGIRVDGLLIEVFLHRPGGEIESDLAVGKGGDEDGDAPLPGAPQDPSSLVAPGENLANGAAEFRR